jgi:ATP-binding protein involved in chromosome partitioning
MMGIEPEFPAEENGIVPLIGPCGIHFMSATVFSGNRPLALRGAEVSDAISELLAVTVWPDLDILIVDLPPGLGEGLLDILRFVPRVEVVAVTTPQAAALAVTRRFLATVSRTATVAGVVANMTDSHGAEEGRPIADLAGQFSTAVLATLPADPGLEAAFGDPKRLSTLPVARAMNDSLTR